MRYDIIGCGEVLLQYHAPAISRLQQSGRLSVRACFDTSPERAAHAARLFGAPRSGTRPDPEAPDRADAAFIATPPEGHAPLGVGYLERGAHVLFEKPFVCSPDEFTRLRTASTGGGVALVGHMRRFYPAIRAARALVADGIVGTVRRVVASEGGRFDWPAASGYVTASPFGGVLYDTGSHVLDTVLFVLGLDEPGAAGATVDHVRRDRAAEPSHDVRARIVLTPSVGAPIPVEVALSRTETLARAVVVHGTAGTLVVPGAFAAAPTLLVRGRPVRLETPLAGPRPADASGCFHLEHEEMVRLVAGTATGAPTATACWSARSDLAAPRFGLLTHLLHEIGRHAA